MRILVGSELTFELVQPTPIIAVLNVHSSRVADVELADQLVTEPQVPLFGYHDVMGNWCNRMIGPAGKLVLRTRGIVRDDGLWDPVPEASEQAQIQDLPSDTLQFLLGSRYCDTDLLSEFAWTRFNAVPSGLGRVQAVVDFVHQHLKFDYMRSRPTRTAREALDERVGVCRDFAHLAIALLRCLNVPARYCTGYISDIGLPKPHAPQDFAAWIEVFLGGQWHTFDPRNNDPRIGRILVARGRDAADVPLTLTFGPATLTGFSVTTEELPELGSQP